MNRLLKIVKGGRRVFSNPRVSKEDYELCNMVFNGGVSLSHLDDFVEGIPFLVVRFETISQLFQEVHPFSEIGFSFRCYRLF